MVWVQIVFAAVLFVVGTLMRKTPEINPAAFEDFGFPDVDPTKRIPIIWGKKTVRSIHTMEVQGYRTRRIRAGNFIQRTTVGYRYYATVAMGICRGPDVTVTRIKLGDRVLWEGTASPSDSGTAITVANRHFFARDNGVAGTIRIYPGSTTQTMNARLAAEHLALGGGNAFPDIPYRGICYLVFEDFYWGNNPQIPQLEVTCERYPDTLSIGANRQINTTANESPTEGTVDLALPEIAHEILTDQIWGLGEPLSDIGSTFTTVAATLRTEANAASLIWRDGDSIQELLSIIMRQAGGFIYKRMSTGLWDMNLARQDYLTGSPVANGTILVFNETNSRLIRYSRGNWDETYNVFYVNWQDRNLKGRPTPAKEQDLANFNIQGTKVETSDTFPGVHSATLAQQLVANQRRALSYPLATAEIVANRLAFDLVPGDVVEFEWDKLGITRIFMRVNKISYGTPEQGEIRMSLVQDVFGTADITFSAPVQSSATQQAADPTDIVTALVEDQSRFLASQDPNNESYNEKPRITALAPQSNALEYIPHARMSPEESFTEQDVEWGYALSGTLQAALAPEDGDVVSIVVEGVVGAADLIVSPQITAQDIREQGEGLIIIETTGSPSARWVGDVSPTHGENEILAYGGVSVVGDTVTLTNVRRALEDTVPMRHNAGDRVWFISGYVGTTVDVYADDVNVNVRLENSTDTGTTGILTANQYPLNTRRRLDRPFVPGYLRLGSTGQSPRLVRYQPGNVPVAAGDILFDWRRRDRTNANLYFQDDADDPPAANYIVDLDIYEAQGTGVTFLRTITGAISSATYTRAQQQTDGGPFNRYVVVLRSYDDSESPRLESLTLVRQEFSYDPFISPLPSPLPVQRSPISPRLASPAISPRSPVPSPISPVPSPISPDPRPSPISPAPPPSPLPSPFVVSPQTVEGFMQNVMQPAHLWFLGRAGSPNFMDDYGSASPLVPMGDPKGDASSFGDQRKLVAGTFRSSLISNSQASPNPGLTNNVTGTGRVMPYSVGTIGALFQPRSDGELNQNIFGYGDSTNSAFFRFQFTPNADSPLTGRFRVETAQEPVADTYEVRLNVDFSYDQTIVVAIRQRGGNNGIEFFVNGVIYTNADSPLLIEQLQLDAGSTVNDWLDVANDEVAAIGRRSNNLGSRQTNAFMSHIFVHDAAYSDQQLYDWYNRMSFVVSPTP